MKIEEIHESWAEDSKIDMSELGRESADIPQLHARWLRRHSDEKLLLSMLKQQQSRLKLKKHEWLLTGETKESRELGWRYPARGAPLRADLDLYLSADKEMQDIEARVTLQTEKVRVLEEIVRQINWRHAAIKNAVEDEKWKQGG